MCVSWKWVDVFSAVIGTRNIQMRKVAHFTATRNYNYRMEA